MMNIRKFLEGIGIIPKTTSTADTAGEMEVLDSDNRLRYHDGTSVKVVTLNDSTDTLTNKTIDADSNTITNIENADIKSGAAIDATKIADGSVSNTEFQYISTVTSNVQDQLDSKASNTALNGHINDATDAHDASAISNVPAGTIAATDVQAAINELDGDIQGHITDATDAHDASAISNVPAGNITSTDVQAAINELDTDLSDHISDTTDAHDASAISNVPAGSIAATDVQAAINELDGDLTTHISDTSTHGVTGDIVGTTDTQTLSNKTLTSPTINTPTVDILTWDDQASTPSNPSAGFYKTYFKSDGSLYSLDSSGVETEIGSGGGGGPSFSAGLNLMLLDTAANNWEAIKTDNFNAELTVGDWAAYADAAGSAPVDMTGGSPNTTITRTTANEINGVASFEMVVSSGATRQGEGVSCLVNIPTAYRGKTLTFKFPFTLTGSLSQDDFRLYAYDVTNSTVITPFTSGKILSANGMALCTFPVSTTSAQVRVGIHIARAVNTGAVTIQFDDVVLTPESTPIGMAGSDWIAYTPTFTSFGTVSNNSFFYSRSGGNIKIKGKATLGTTVATEARISLPVGLTIDSTIIPSIRPVGSWGRSSGAANGGTLILAEPGASYVVLAATNASGGLSKLNGDSFNSSSDLAIEAEVPITGWSSNVSMSESSTFFISSYLANGTRVTGSAPAKLGEYRSYLRNAGAHTFTETNASPGTAPSAANGILLYGGNAFSSADSNNEPSYYEIFIGKNKNYSIEFYSSTGKTGAFTTDVVSASGADYGVEYSYSPTTGIVTVIDYRRQTAGTTHDCGWTTSGFGNAIHDAYFDIKVSENALAVGTQAPRSEVVVHTGNGHGSTNTKIRRYTTIQKNIGSAVTYADSATLGASFTINEDGIYCMQTGDYAVTTANVGISKNSTQLTTDVGSINAADVLVIGQSVNAFVGTVSVCAVLAAGDVIRPHHNGNHISNDLYARFSIVKVSN
jgi:hypothetical protein